MKKMFFFTLSIFFSFLIHAQPSGDSNQLKNMLFEKFIEGTVLMKSGEVESAPLNYNTDNQSVVFIKNGQYLVLTGLETIDTVYLQNKKFVPEKNVFYEVISKGSVTLLVNYTNKGRPVVATADHNGSSKQLNNQVSNTVSDVYVNRIYKGNFRVEIFRNYWIKKDTDLKKANTKNQFLKLFSSLERDAIERYIVSKGVNFNNENDLVALVDFCNKELE